MSATGTVERRPTVPLARHLLGLVRQWRSRLLVVCGCVLGAALLELIPPLIVRQVVDELSRNRTTDLARAAFGYLAATTGVAVLAAVYTYLAASVAERSLALLRARLFAHLLGLPTSYHDKTPLGDSVSRATADVETIDDLFSSSVSTLFGELVRLGTVLVAMLVLSPVLTLAALVEGRAGHAINWLDYPPLVALGYDRIVDLFEVDSAALCCGMKRRPAWCGWSVRAPMASPRQGSGSRPVRAWPARRSPHAA